MRDRAMATQPGAVRWGASGGPTKAKLCHLSSQPGCNSRVRCQVLGGISVASASSWGPCVVCLPSQDSGLAHKALSRPIARASEEKVLRACLLTKKLILKEAPGCLEQEDSRMGGR